MQEGELLWVYEGMTQYLGNVLAARSGLKSQAAYRDILAASAANLEYKSGRWWRTTDDTAIAASVLRGRDQTWANWRRGQDYYQEGELLWLDADTKIRELTDDKKSLTDFLHIFLGKGGNTGPLIAFLHDRVDLINPHADLDGITRGGYKLVYRDTPTRSERSGGGRGPAGPNVWYSLGLRLNAEGVISDVRWGSPADKAKLAPGQKLIAVNGRVFSAPTGGAGEEGAPKGVLHEALVAAKTSAEPIHFLVQTESYIRTVDVDYHDGEKFPAMVRVEGTKDYLDEITTPLTKP
jgi:predicted metalloprotease with PDZ domain